MKSLNTNEITLFIPTKNRPLFLYRLIKYLNTSDDTHEIYTKEELDSDTRNQIVNNVTTNNNIQLRKPECKLVNKFIPSPESNYNKDFYEKIKFL